MEKVDHRGTNAEVQEFIRKRSIQAVEELGYKVPDVAKVFGVDERRIYEWLTIYRTQGLEGLDKKPRLGSQPLLSEWEMQKVKEIVSERTPRMYGYEQEVWTANVAAKVIEQVLEITLSEATVARLLTRLGFSYRRASKQAVEQSEEEVAEWLEEKFPKIQEEAEREGRIIYFEDEAGIDAPGSGVSGWFPKEETAFVETTGKHLHLTVLGAISSSGALRFHLSNGSTNRYTIIDFIKQLQATNGQPITLLFDNLSAHAAQEVIEYVGSTQGRVKIYFFPAYSPRLNPQELVWNDIKNDIKKKAVHGFSELRDLTSSGLRSLQNNTEKVRRYFQHEDIRYAI